MIDIIPSVEISSERKHLMADEDLILTPQGIADAVEDSTRRVLKKYFLYTGDTASYELKFKNFRPDIKPNISRNLSISYDADLLRLETVVRVLMDVADTVFENDIGLKDRAGLVLRWQIDIAVRHARRNVDMLHEASEQFGLDSNASIFGFWPESARNLVRKHPLFELEKMDSR